MRCNYSVIAIILFSFTSASCELFNTRDPDDPITDIQSNPPASSADILVDNLLKSLLHKNTTDYEKLFADTTSHLRSFVFIPTPSAKATYSVSWDKSLEKRYFDNVMGAMATTSSPNISFTSISTIFQYSSDSVAYSVDYDLFIPHNKQNIITQQFVGRCGLYMSPDKHETWRIYRWEDFGKKDSSWSDLKGQFRD